MRQVLYSPELGKKSICSLIVLVPYLSFLQELVFSLGNSVRSSYERMCVCVCVCALTRMHMPVCVPVCIFVCVYMEPLITAEFPQLLLPLCVHA